MTVRRSSCETAALVVLLALTAAGCGRSTRVVLGSHDNSLAEGAGDATAGNAAEPITEQPEELVEPEQEPDESQAPGPETNPKPQPEAGTGGSEQPVAGVAMEASSMRLEPQLPEVVGECPPLTTGSITLDNGIGLEIAAGEPAQSGGSLVFYWHGTGSFSGEYDLMFNGAMQQLLAEGGILVSPQESVGTGGDCSGTATWSKDDFNWADQIVACAVRDYNIDPTRIYTTGCSSGGLQAGCMGTLRSSYIAAVASNSGGIITPEPFQDSEHIPALLTMHGAPNSDVVIVSFTETSHTLGEQFTGAGGTWVDCNHGGGHCGASGLSAAAWDFMQAHPFGVGDSPYAGGLPAEFPAYCTLQSE